MSRLATILFSILLLLGAATFASAQSDDDELMFPGRPKKEDPPQSLKDAMVKLRIEKDKKDFDAMLKRGDDAAKLANDLKEGPASAQRDQISGIGKLVKKIRDELGGEGDDDSDEPLPTSEAEAIKALKEQVNTLSDELKKATRFTVSAEAIDRTNTILKLVKFLHG